MNLYSDKLNRNVVLSDLLGSNSAEACRFLEGLTEILTEWTRAQVWIQSYARNPQKNGESFYVNTRVFSVGNIIVCDRHVSWTVFRRDKAVSFVEADSSLLQKIEDEMAEE